jgi:hypothetical protein
MKKEENREVEKIEEVSINAKGDGHPCVTLLKERYRPSPAGVTPLFAQAAFFFEQESRFKGKELKSKGEELTFKGRDLKFKG